MKGLRQAALKPQRGCETKNEFRQEDISAKQQAGFAYRQQNRPRLMIAIVFDKGTNAGQINAHM